MSARATSNWSQQSGDNIDIKNNLLLILAGAAISAYQKYVIFFSKIWINGIGIDWVDIY